jgi:hypothetical protein
VRPRASHIARFASPSAQRLTPERPKYSLSASQSRITPPVSAASRPRRNASRSRHAPAIACGE